MAEREEVSVVREEPQTEGARKREVAGSAIGAAGRGPGPAAQESESATETPPDVAAICTISNIKLEGDLHTGRKDDLADQVGGQGLCSAVCAEPPVDESLDDETAPELKNAGNSLEQAPSAQREDTLHDKADSEQQEAAQQPKLPSAQPYQPLMMGQVGWEKVPDRPPQKLPIRFKDCVGRNIMIPWKVARLWPDVRNLINNTFTHVDVLGPHVRAGHYDLVVHNVWMAADSAVVNPELKSFQHVAPLDAGSSVPPSSTAAGPAMASSVPETATSPSIPTGCLGPGSSIILPELWEDIVEPGMLITMHMWPMSVLNPPHVAPPPPGPTTVDVLPPVPPGWAGRRRPRRRPSPPPRMKTRRRQG